MATKLLRLITVSICLLAAACGSPNASENTSTTSSAEYRAMTVDEFADILASRADEYTIINVHIPYEGEVPNTDAHVPFNDVDALTSALPDKNAPIILYCRSGRMSEQASHTLLDLGYTDVWDVTGGMNAWQESGRELIYE